MARGPALRERDHEGDRIRLRRAHPPSPGTPGEVAGVRVIPRTGCLGLATPDTWYFESPSPYPLPEYREREAAAHTRSPWGSREHVHHRLPLAVAGDVERALLDVVGQGRRDADGAVDRRVQVLDDDRVLDDLARPLVGGRAVDVAAASCRRRTSGRAGVGEVAVHAVVACISSIRSGHLRPGRGPSLPSLPSIIMSRLNSLASTISVRSSRPRSSRSSTSCATGASIISFIARSRVWPFSCVSQFRNGMYSVVTSMNRAPTSASRRASRQPSPNRPAICIRTADRSGVMPSSTVESVGRYWRPTPSAPATGRTPWRRGS